MQKTRCRLDIARWCVALLALFAAQFAPAQNCTRSPTGWPPLSDLGTGSWNGMQGGLYPNGSNRRPAAHDSIGRALSRAIVPIDTLGVPSPAGRVVLLTIGMSNTSYESAAFLPMLAALSGRSPALVAVNGCQSGQELRRTSSDSAPYWSYVSAQLRAAHASDAQVQVIWLKQAISAPTDSAFADALAMYDSLMIAVLHIVRARFVNLKLCFLSSRIYAGYATTTLNPEPYAYYSGWAVKRLIERQIAGDTTLRCTGSAARAPWLAWGPYLWADGTHPRADGLDWRCPVDFRSDGTHPSDSGAQKVARLLLAFFTTDSLCRPWVLGSQSGVIERVPFLSPPTVAPQPVVAGEEVSVCDAPAASGPCQLLDLLGRTRWRGTMVAGHARVSTSGLPPGIYRWIAPVSGRAAPIIVIR